MGKKRQINDQWLPTTASTHHHPSIELLVLYRLQLLMKDLHLKTVNNTLRKQSGRPSLVYMERWLIGILGVVIFVPTAPEVQALLVPSALYTNSITMARGIGSRIASSSLLETVQGGDKDVEEASDGKSPAKVVVALVPGERQEKRQLSRPERKALERQKKVEQQRSKNRKSKPSPESSSSSSSSSSVVSRFTDKSTADDVTRAIKRAQNNHNHHDLKAVADFLIDECEVGFAYGYRGSLLARLAVAALHFSNHQIARRAIDIRRLEYRPSMMPMESAAIIRGLLRVHNATDALEVLHDELSLPLEGTALDTPASQDRLKHRALSLASIASRYFFEDEPALAVMACKMLSELGPLIRQAKLSSEALNMPWLRIIQGAGHCETARRAGTLKLREEDANVELPCNVVYAVLNAMSTFPSENDDLVFEAISNALVRRVLFVTGAIDMSGCPPADRGEAVFIGRSNVGKSSLVNMITNRKSLAFTSKRPGKTQQFNFFAVNDKPGREKEIRYGDVVLGERDLDSFNIVDLPGFGFARVPEKQRQDWARFMAEFLSKRKTLRVVFHLVDGRHGPIDEDATIMKQVGESLPKNVAYVVVLTKADKNVKAASRKQPGKVSIDVMNSVREAMRANKVGNAPVIVTSAETKLGRDDLWRYLRLAAEAY